MDDRHVVTAFLHRAGQVLLLRRSAKVSSYQGRWAGVSGSLEGGATPLDQALREIREETGLTGGQVQFESAGIALVADAGTTGRRFVVHPLRFWVRADAEPKLDWEHSECAWVDPAEIGEFAGVPRLAETWRRVAPSAIARAAVHRRLRALATDRVQGAGGLALAGLALLGEAALAHGVAPEPARRDLKHLAAALAGTRPAMIVIANLAAAWWSRVCGQEPGADPLRAGRQAAQALIAEQRRAAGRAAVHAATALAGARTIATGSYSASVLAALAALAEQGARPQIRVAASGAGPDSHGRRLAARLTGLGLRARVFSDAAVQELIDGSEVLCLGADAIDPSRSVVNGRPSARLAAAAHERGIPVIVVGTSARLTENVQDLALEQGLERVRGAWVTQIVTEQGPADAATLRKLATTHTRAREILLGQAG